MTRTAPLPLSRALGAKAVLLKGGHLEGDTVRDLLIEQDGVTDFVNDRIASRHTHGTGCTLASAIATGVADGMSLRNAVGRGIAYVREAILTAPGLGRGHGPLNHGHTAAPLHGRILIRPFGPMSFWPRFQALLSVAP